MTATTTKTDDALTVTASTSQNIVADKQRNSKKGSSSVFHFPPSVLSFFQDDHDNQTTNTNTTATSSSSSTSSTSVDDTHTSTEARQPESTRQQQQARLSFLSNLDERDPSFQQLSTSLGSGATFQDLPKSTLQTCLNLLSSADLDLNRVGLQRLMLLTKGRALSGLYRSEAFASSVLVYGGPFGSLEDRLRYIFATMICDAPHDDSEMQNQSSLLPTEETTLFQFDLQALVDGQCGERSSCSSDSFSDGSEFDSGAPQGKSWGALHLQGVRVLANALSQICHNHSGENVKTSIVSKRTIPLHDTIWRNIIQSLVHNIETNHTADITGYSLKILRLLHTIQPEMVQPLLEHTLFPHLVYLQEYGEGRLFPVIHSEAAYLLRRAKFFVEF